MSLNRLITALLYLFAVAAFTSMAALSLFQILMLLISFYAAFLFFRNGGLQLSQSQKYLLAYAGVAMVSLMISGGVPQVFSELGAIMRLVMAVVMVYSLKIFICDKESTKHFRYLLLTIIITSMLAHLSGAIGLFTGFNPLKFETATDPQRSTGMYGMAITYGNSAQFLLLLFIGLFSQRKKLQLFVNRNWLFAACLLTGVGLALSKTRGAWLGVVIGLPFLYVQSSPKFFRRALLGSVVLLGLVISAMFFAPKTSRFYYMSDSNMIRISQYKTAWYAFKEKPLLGHGFRQFSTQVRRLKLEHNIAFKDFNGNAHNNFVEAIASTGLLGFTIFILFLLAWLREILDLNHFLAPTILSVWVAFVFSGLFQNTFTDGENVYLLFFIYACSQILQNKLSCLSRRA